MKTKFTLIVCAIMIALAANAQQPANFSFDTWTDSLNPDGWSTYESTFHSPLGGQASKDAVDKIAGPYSLKLRSDSVPGFPAYGVLPGICSYGTSSAPGGMPTFNRVAFPYRPDTIFVGYKYVTPGPGRDTARVYLRLRNGNTDLLFYTFLFDTTSQWALGYIVLTNLYSGATVPDSMGLRLYASNVRPVKGSTLNVDAVFFGYAAGTGIEEVAEKLELSVYPNPTTDYINVKAIESLTGYQIVITDMAGKISAIRPLEGNNSRIDVSNLSTGVYTYRIADKNGNFIKYSTFNVAK